MEGKWVWAGDIPLVNELPTLWGRAWLEANQRGAFEAQGPVPKILSFASKASTTYLDGPRKKSKRHPCVLQVALSSWQRQILWALSSG